MPNPVPRFDRARVARVARVALVALAACVALGAPAAAAPAPAATGARTPNDADYFVGTWTCASVAWTFDRPSPNSTWYRDVYGDPAEPYGTATFGYVAKLGVWVYRDFHADGAYAELTSPPPVDGRWVWTGPYYPADGSGPLHGRITYARVDAGRFDRTFESLESGAYVARGHDTCTKQAK